MFVLALFTITKVWKQPQGPLTEMNEENMVYLYKYDMCIYMLYIYTVEYDSVFEKKEILPFATIWLNLEDIMLSKVSQSRKDKYCMVPLI